MNSDSLPIAQVESDLSPGLCSVFAKVKRQSVKNNKNKSLRWEVDKSELYNDFKEKVNLHKHEGKEQIENCWMKRQLVMPVINYLRSWRNRMQCQKKKKTKNKKNECWENSYTRGKFLYKTKKSMSALKAVKGQGKPAAHIDHTPGSRWNLRCSIILKTPEFPRIFSRTLTWK